MASTSASAAARAVAGRSVHLKIFPRPRNLAESREILNVIQRYGEVEMFKHLKYEQVPARNTAIAIFKNVQAAEQALLASPVHFTYGQASDSIVEDREGSKAPSDNYALYPSPNASTQTPSQPQPSHITLRYPPMTIPNPDAHINPLDGRSDNAVPEDRPPDGSTLEKGEDPYASDPRPCSIHVSGSRQAHKDYIKRQWYYGGFKVEPGSRPGLDVLGPLPEGLEGLGNGEIKAERGLRTRRKERNGGGNGNGNGNWNGGANRNWRGVRERMY